MNNKALRIFCKLFLCAVFAILDYYISLFAKLHFKPLFLDTLFEMTAAFAFGPVYGILCVLAKRVYNIIMVPDLTRWPHYLYSFCTIFGILILCPFNKRYLKNERDMLFLIIKLFFLSLLICLEMSIAGGVIGRIVGAIMHTKYSMTVQTDGFMQFFSNFTHNTLLLEIISRIPVNIIDRIIATYIPFFIALGVSRIPVFKEKQNH